ncbi:MAG: hypothetical protein H6581_30510 [Bacteroidia bacterium]|nr:hypothetical protein [Bacteroidia bacterium]
MFKEFFLLEITRGLRRPMVWLFMGIVAIFTFAATCSDSVVLGAEIGNVFRNAPGVITTIVGTFTLIGLLFTTAFINNAALRDFDNNFHEILFSTPIRKGAYFFGRFFGAWFLSTVPMLGVYVGVIAGTWAAPTFGWIGEERFGPFYLETFVNTYLLFVLPNMFFAGTVLFALANRFRSSVISFLGTLLIIIGYIASGALISDLDNETVAALTDIFGNRTYRIETKYFTPIEQNTVSPGFHGLLLINRLIWMAAGAVILGINYFTFSFAPSMRKAGKVKAEKAAPRPAALNRALKQQFGFSTSLAQFFSFFKVNFLSIVRSTTFVVIFIFLSLLIFVNLINGFEYFGLQSYPVTYKMVDQIGALSGLFVLIILIFFSGELVWRDREKHIQEVIDATPHGSAASLVGRTLSLFSVGMLLHLFAILCCILYQVLSGYFNLELNVYLSDFFLKSFFSYFIWSAIFVFIQVLVNSKYIAYFVSVALLIFWEIALGVLDFASNMLAIGDGPSLQYSDMNGFGAGVTGALWFDVYWGLIGVLALLAAGLLWTRGTNLTLKVRFKTALKNLRGRYALLMGGTLVVWIGVAAFVYYNTLVLNKFTTSDQQEKRNAEYEKTYKKYEKLPLPKITDVRFNLDIYPQDRDVKVKSEIRLVNRSGAAIQEIHFSPDPDWHPKIMIPGASLTLNDTVLNYRIYTLSQPMQPGDTMDVVVETAYLTRGFENEVGNPYIAANGTFINSMDILPALGYQERREIADKNTRRKYNLEPKVRMPRLQSPCTDLCMNNYLTNGLADWVNLETFISTSGDQIAVAPGSLLKEWQEEGRNHYHYKVDHPSQFFCSFISARFEVARRKWKGIDLEIYYDAKHGVNIEMMLDALEMSMAYFTENFGPYFHQQARIIEFPRYSTFAQAFPGTMPYSEAFGFVVNLEDTTENNVVNAVIAHEMGHQWWAHQVIGANMQGATLLSESFAEYSSLMVMHQQKTDLEMKEFLKYDMNRYLNGRKREVENERPLYLVENQDHIHYGKGSVIMYALQDYIGEDRVNQALHDFLEQYRYQEPPYPTSQDFLTCLEPQVPDTFKYLIDDWFKEITLYDHRLKEAELTQTGEGQYNVHLQIESEKVKADTIGNETVVPINDWVEVGVFADRDLEDAILLKKVKFNQPAFELDLTVDREPKRVVIDPRKLLIERITSDNEKPLEMK